MVNTPSAWQDPLASDGAGRAALVIGVTGGAVLLAPLLAAALLGALGGAVKVSDPAVSATAAAEIPADQLAVMQRVSRESGIPWQIFAAIARVESHFGRNMATSSAGAVGYGQFLPSTWAAFGRGGDPYDYRDVIPAMARYLLAHGAPADLRRALYAYNHSWAYVDDVLARAAAYGTGRNLDDTAPSEQRATSGDLGARALAAALAQRGKPYVFGAAGPDAFDCSGLVQWAYRQAGVATPRTAQQQYDWARPLTAAETRPGDLAFFARTYPSTDVVTHVGIYAGGGQMVVAPRAGDPVRLEPLDTPYWRAHFAGFGRVPAVDGRAGTALALAVESRPMLGRSGIPAAAAGRRGTRERTEVSA